MGKYINKNSKSEQIGMSFNEKLTALKEDGATVIEAPKDYQPNLVCVVDNGIFAAAAYADSPSEMEVFKSPDGRRKIWLSYPHASAVAA